MSLLAMIMSFASTLIAAPVQQIAVNRVTVSAPADAATVDLGKLKGTLRRLSWAPDGTQFYVQTAEADARLGWKLRHYIVTTDGKPPTSVKEEPAWSATYWNWKSSQTAPGMPSLKIGVDQQTQRVSATATPMGGNAARGEAISGMGISPEEVGNVTQQSQNVQVFTLTLNGEIVGQFMNTPAIPGLTFGWGKTGSGLIAFSRPDGQLVLMDGDGKKQEVATARNARVPGFTSDGSRLAWLEKVGRNKYTLRIANVSVEGQ